MSDENIKVGDRIKVHVDNDTYKSKGWFNGVVVKIVPYEKSNKNLNFYYVQLDTPIAVVGGGFAGQISVFNPKNFEKI